MDKLFEDFKLEKEVPDDIVNKYKGRVPEELIKIWETYGFGTFLNGYLKIINPEEYEDLLSETYIQNDENIKFMTTLFATGMGDLIIWEYVSDEDSTITLLKYRIGKYRIIGPKLKIFLKLLELKDEDFLNEELGWAEYSKAIELYSKLDYDECFSYVPLLPLGGKESVCNLKKVKLIEQINLITDLLGPIDDIESCF
ncbi:Domain of uncharacterised function (DUF1851) [[Clostridium] sordellii]|uniref:T6SS immunity protein Tdi1 domain-containing protein n=1 Tax=Paraclostridium sordellii TaxID=1505 RepID=UPI0005E7205F|nr:T6SS immunity protein Tdi1 domain-containing protein [Paeniclostridium sordellii]CEP46540.1 Domain of uncharacterised function (DUF1851) [[Clostridium] sordellii] [Paeniclostridium sordellii]